MDGNPQIEDGFTRFANEIVDQFCHYHLSGVEWQILWAVLRKTYGWQKKEDWISLSQFEQMTGIKKPNIIRALNRLIERKIVIKNDNGKGKTYRFNKHYAEWKPVIKIDNKIIKNDNDDKIKLVNNSASQKVIKNDNGNKVIKNDNLALSKMIPTKETITKENNNKYKELENLTSLDAKKYLKDTEGAGDRIFGIFVAELEKEVPEKKLMEFWERFGEVLGVSISVGYRAKYYKEALLLLKDHTVTELIDASKIGKEEIRRQNKALTLLNPKTLLSNADVWGGRVIRIAEKGRWTL